MLPDYIAGSMTVWILIAMLLICIGAFAVGFYLGQNVGVRKAIEAINADPTREELTPNQKTIRQWSRDHAFDKRWGPAA